jgi:hypothetical protein
VKSLLRSRHRLLKQSSKDNTYSSDRLTDPERQLNSLDLVLRDSRLILRAVSYSQGVHIFANGVLFRKGVARTICMQGLARRGGQADHGIQDVRSSKRDYFLAFPLTEETKIAFLREPRFSKRLSGLWVELH